MPVVCVVCMCISLFVCISVNPQALSGVIHYAIITIYGHINPRFYSQALSGVIHYANKQAPSQAERMPLRGILHGILIVSIYGN